MIILVGSRIQIVQRALTLIPLIFSGHHCWHYLKHCFIYYYSIQNQNQNNFISEI